MKKYGDEPLIVSVTIPSINIFSLIPVCFIYTNGSVLVGINGLKSSFSSDDDYDDYDDYYDYYYRSYEKSISTIDTGIALGLGLDFYLTNNILLFGEINRPLP